MTNIFLKVEIDGKQVPTVPSINDLFQLPSSVSNSEDIIFLPTSGSSTPLPVKFHDNSKHISLSMSGDDSLIYMVNDPTITDSPAPTTTRHVPSGSKVVVASSPMSDDSDSVFTIPSSKSNNVSHNDRERSYNEYFNEGVRFIKEKKHKNVFKYKCNILGC